MCLSETVPCFTGRDSLSRRSLPANTLRNCKCYIPCRSFASNEVRTKHIHKGLTDQIFASHMKTLTEGFKLKLSGEGKPLFREFEGYLWRPRPDRSLITSQTQRREFDVKIESTTRTVPRNFRLCLQVFGDFLQL
jgi:hypothetical protein